MLLAAVIDECLKTVKYCISTAYEDEILFFGKITYFYYVRILIFRRKRVYKDSGNEINDTKKSAFLQATVPIADISWLNVKVGMVHFGNAVIIYTVDLLHLAILKQGK